MPDVCEFCGKATYCPCLSKAAADRCKPSTPPARTGSDYCPYTSCPTDGTTPADCPFAACPGGKR